MQSYNVYGVRIYHAERGAHSGVTGLPTHFAATLGEHFLIVGEPSNDVVQWGLSEAGFTRLNLLRRPAGDGQQGVMNLLTQCAA